MVNQKEYFRAAGGSLINAVPEFKKEFDDKVTILMEKYNFKSANEVEKLDVKLEPTKVTNAASILLEQEPQATRQ